MLFLLFIKNSSINFDGFIINFDTEGKGILNIEEEKEEDLKRVFETYPNIYKGDKLPKSAQVSEIKKEVKSSEIDILKEKNSEISILKEGNKKFAIENANLKKENEELKNQICTLTQANKVEEKFIEEKQNDTTIVENSSKDISIKEDLEKKTISQLKGVLNTEDFFAF